MEMIQPLPVFQPAGVPDEDASSKTPPKTWVVMVRGFSGQENWNSITWRKHWLPPGDDTIEWIFLPEQLVVENFSELQMETAARNLLNKITENWHEGDLITFWAHDVGGTLVKLALDIAAREPEYWPILKATHMLIFFATPHRSSASYSMDSALHALIEAYHPGLLGEWFPSILNRLSRLFESIGNKFNSISHLFSIISYYQQSSSTKPHRVMIPEECATLRVENEIVINSDRPHHSLSTVLTRREEYALQTHIFNTKIKHWEKFRHFMFILTSVCSKHTPNRPFGLRPTSGAVTARFNQDPTLLNWISSSSSHRYLTLKLGDGVDHTKFLNTLARVIQSYADALWAPCPDFDVGYPDEDEDLNGLDDEVHIYVCLLQQILSQQPGVFLYMQHLAPIIVDAMTSNAPFWKKRALWLGLKAVIQAPIDLPTYGFLHLHSEASIRVFQRLSSVLNGIDSRFRLVLTYSEKEPIMGSDTIGRMDLACEAKDLKDCLRDASPLIPGQANSKEAESSVMVESLLSGLQASGDESAILRRLLSLHLQNMGRPAFVALVWIAFAQRPLTLFELDTVLALDDRLPSESDKQNFSIANILHLLPDIVEINQGKVLLCMSYEKVRTYLSTLSKTYLEINVSPNIYIAQSCLSLLAQSIFKNPTNESGHEDLEANDAEKQNQMPENDSKVSNAASRNGDGDDQQWIIVAMNSPLRFLAEYAARNWLVHYKLGSASDVSLEQDKVYSTFARDEKNIVNWLSLVGYLSNPCPRFKANNFIHIYDEQLKKHLHHRRLQDLDILYELAAHPLTTAGIGRYLVYAAELGIKTTIHSLLADPSSIPKDALLRAVATSSGDLHDHLRDKYVAVSESSHTLSLSLAQLSAQLLGNRGTMEKLEKELFTLNSKENIEIWSQKSLQRAIEYDDEALANELLAREDVQTWIHKTSDGQCSAIHRAVSSGNLQLLTKLVGLDTSGINKPSIDGLSPLFVASCHGFAECVQLLLSNGAQIDQINTKSERTALHIAGHHGHFETVKVLLENGASITAADVEGNFALHIAIKQAQVRVAELLIEHFPRIDQGAETLETPLTHDHDVTATLSTNPMPDTSSSLKDFVALDLSQDLELTLDGDDHGEDQLLLQFVNDANAAPLNLANLEGMTALLVAAQRDLPTVGQRLLEWGADPNIMNDQSDIALHLASKAGAVGFIRALLEKKSVTTDIVDDLTATPLHFACYRGFALVAEILVKGGSDLLVEDKWGRTAFSAACFAGHLDTVNTLLTYYDQERRAEGLEAAVKMGHRDVVKRLLDSGCPVNGAGNDKPVPLMTAVSDQNARMVELLLLRGADIELEDASQYQPLHLASENGSTGIVKLLVDAGAQIDALNRQRNALAIAIFYECSDTVRFLLERGARMRLPPRWDHVGSLLELSWRWSTAEISKVLLDFYVRGKQEDGLTPAKALIAAMTLDHGMDDMKLILDTWLASDVSPNASVGDAIHYAVTHGHLRFLEMILQHPLGKAAMNEEKGSAGTPLHAAISSSATEDKEIVDMLLRERADPDVVAGRFGTTLNLACAEGKYDIAKKLLDVLSWNTITSMTGKYGNPIQSAIADFRIHSVERDETSALELFQLLEERGVSPTAIGGYYLTALHAAAHCRVPMKILTWLLQKASRSLRVTDHVGRLPLHLAILRGDWDVIEKISNDTEKLLPIVETPWKCRDLQGLTGLHYAAMSESEVPMLKILELCQTEEEIREAVSFTDDDGWTPLHWACRSKKLEIVQALVNKGANTSLRTNEGWTPRQIAVLHGVKDDEYLNLLPDLEITDKTLPKRSQRCFMAGGYCDACWADLYWHFYACEECDDFVFCFKCYKRVNDIHIGGHEFLMDPTI